MPARPEAKETVRRKARARVRLFCARHRANWQLDRRGNGPIPENRSLFRQPRDAQSRNFELFC